MIRRPSPLPLLLMLLPLAIAAGAGPGAAETIFSEASLYPDAISPNGDGIQEFTEIRYTIAADSADVRILVAEVGGGAPDTLQVFTRQAGTHSRPFDGTGATGPLPDGDYEIRILGIGSAGEGVEEIVLDLLVDRVAPGITLLNLVEPDQPVVTDGTRVTVQACFDEEADSLSADYAALDSEFDPALVSTVPLDGNCTRFSYTISSVNTLSDAAGLPVTVFVADRAGNSSTASLPLCLSNFPPVITEAALLNEYPVYQNGDVIVAEIRVESPNVVEVGGDFSNLDSNANPSLLEVVDLGGGRFRLDYSISTANTRPDGDYELRLTVTDANGCGAVENRELTVTLDNEGALAALIDEVRVDPLAISPANQDGVNDEATFFFDVLEDTVSVIITGKYYREDDPERVQTVLIANDDFLEGRRSVVWDGSFPEPWENVPDQVIPIEVRAISIAKDRQRTVQLAVDLDHAPPVLQSFRPPVPEKIQNGDRVDFSVVYDAAGYRLTPDFAPLDSDFVPGETSFTVADSGNGAYGISYVVSLTNTRPDGRDKIVPITAVDLAGNATTDDGFIRLCLSNQPPRLVSAELLDNQGPFGPGDQIAIRTEWEDGRWTASQPLSIEADFSSVDTEFEDRKDKVEVIPREVTGGRAVFDIAYRISTGNDLEEGFDRPLYATALDHEELGCGATTAEAVRVDYDSLDPLRPTLDTPESVVRTAVITLSGEAPEAVEVRLLRGDTIVDTLEVDELSRFEGPVQLEPGANTFTAEGVDRAGNVSKPSNEVEVFFVQDTQFEVPGRFSPDDEFFVALLEPADEVWIRIFNLEGMEIARLEQGAGDLYRIPWDGRDTTGTLSSSGPYIAVAEIRRDGSTDRRRQAFFFSRNGGS